MVREVPGILYAQVVGAEEVSPVFVIALVLSAAFVMCLVIGTEEGE